MTTTTADYTPKTWATKLLQLLGAPTSDANVQAVTAWETAEGGHWNNPDRYNPLNTTQSEPGAVSTNGAGVKAYTSWDQGLTATVSTLTNGLYGGILSALQRGDSADAVVSAVVASPWGTKQIPLGGSAGSAAAGSSAGSAGSAAAGSTVTQAGLLSGVGKDVQSIAVKAVILLGGVALVVLGLVRAGAPAVQRAAETAERVQRIAEA